MKSKISAYLNSLVTVLPAAEIKSIEAVLSGFEAWCGKFPPELVKQESLVDICYLRNYYCDIKSDGRKWQIVLRGMSANQPTQMVICETYPGAESKARAYLETLPDKEKGER